MGVEELAAIAAGSGLLKSISGANGNSKACSLECTADVVIAVGKPGETDYMPIPPVGTSFYGAASTVLVLSAVDAVTVTETCSDGSTKTFAVVRRSRDV